jgi:hypothetical protein
MPCSDEEPANVTMMTSTTTTTMIIATTTTTTIIIIINVIKKESEKILKYKVVIIEIQRMWNVTAKVILLIVIGATGTM